MLTRTFSERRRFTFALAASGAYTVVNLAYNNEGAYSFTFTMKDYGYLDHDLVCLYEGYNDLAARQTPDDQ